jgi:hypothetical protein
MIEKYSISSKIVDVFALYFYIYIHIDDYEPRHIYVAYILVIVWIQSKGKTNFNLGWREYYLVDVGYIMVLVFYLHIDRLAITWKSGLYVNNNPKL